MVFCTKVPILPLSTCIIRKRLKLTTTIAKIMAERISEGQDKSEVNYGFLQFSVDTQVMGH